MLFKKTYFATGVSDKLVTSGKSALVRHPWTTWYALLMLSLVPVTRAHDRKSITTFISSFRQLKTEPMTKGGNPHV